MRILLLLALAGLGACSSTRQAAPPPAPTFNPVGTYDFTADVQGQAVPGTVTIAGTPGSYTGAIEAEGQPTMPLNSVTVDGTAIRLVGDSPNGPITVVMTFVGNAFTGNWSMDAAGLAGTLRGTKRGS